MSPSGTPSKRLGWLPAALALLLGAFALCPRVQRSEHLWWAFVGVSAALVGWWAALRLVRRARGGGLETLVIPPVRQHYIQACVQLVLYGYWGWMWVVDGVRPKKYVRVPMQAASARAAESMCGSSMNMLRLSRNVLKKNPGALGLSGNWMAGGGKCVAGKDGYIEMTVAASSGRSN